MKIFVVGDNDRFELLKDKLSDDHDIDYHEVLDSEPDNTDLIIDLNLDENPENLSTYAQYENLAVFGCSVKRQLAEMAAMSGREIECSLFGINAIPGFLQRELTEVSILRNDDENKLNSVAQELNWKTELIGDRVGMVTPRIVLMIINEAFYTVQEGTADEQAIDQGMKLGTNYPFGPFEWTDKIGIKNVYEILAALYEDTRDERYRISARLKTAYLRQEADIDD